MRPSGNPPESSPLRCPAQAQTDCASDAYFLEGWDSRPYPKPIVVPGRVHLTREIGLDADGRRTTVTIIMQPPDVPDPIVARDVFLDLVRDPALGVGRRSYCHAMTDILASAASWLAVDAWLGGGKVSLGSSEPLGGAYLEFRGFASVVEIAAELARGCVTLLEADLFYPNAALVRQLIESEYLLVLFTTDPGRAAEWAQATPDEVRKTFSPKVLRSLGGDRFSDSEYWNHCDAGGHPSPVGCRLLGWGGHLMSTRDLLGFHSWLDLAQHLQRIWRATSELLTKHHARFSGVRSSDIAKANTATNAWVNSDPLAAGVSANLLAMLEMTAERSTGL